MHAVAAAEGSPKSGVTVQARQMHQLSGTALACVEGERNGSERKCGDDDGDAEIVEAFPVSNARN